MVDYTRCEKGIAAEITLRFSSEPFDCVLDCVGIQELFTASAGFLKPDNPYVATIVKPKRLTLPSFLLAVLRLGLNTVWPTTKLLGGTGRKWKTVYMMDATKAEKEELLKMVGDGALSVQVDSAWDFEDALKGYEVLESSRAKGKIVIRVGDGA